MAKAGAFVIIAADALEILPDRIARVSHGSLTSSGSFRAAVPAAAARRLWCEPGEIELLEGRIAQAHNGRSITLAELAAEGLGAKKSLPIAGILTAMPRKPLTSQSIRAPAMSN